MKMNIDDESKNSGYKFGIQSIILDHPYIPKSACVKMI